MTGDGLTVKDKVRRKKSVKHVKWVTLNFQIAMWNLTIVWRGTKAIKLRNVWSPQTHSSFQVKVTHIEKRLKTGGTGYGLIWGWIVYFISISEISIMKDQEEK